MKNPRILIADDDAKIRQALRKRLRARDFGVVESADGLDVIGKCHDGTIDLAILDHEMPNGDGITIARVIRNESNIPIIFLSGHSSHEFESTMREVACTYFMSKSEGFEELIDLVESVSQPV